RTGASELQHLPLRLLKDRHGKRVRPGDEMVGTRHAALLLATIAARVFPSAARMSQLQPAHVVEWETPAMPEDAMNLRDALRIPSAEVTDEAVWEARRRIVAGFAALPAIGLAGCAAAEPPPPPGPAPTPDQVRAGFATDEELTRW